APSRPDASGASSFFCSPQGPLHPVALRHDSISPYAARAFPSGRPGRRRRAPRACRKGAGVSRTETPSPRATVPDSGSALDRYFHISERGSTVRIEVMAGFATFLTMAYILFVNPAILGAVKDPAGTSLPFDQVLTVTALVAGAMTLLMGIYAKYPFALAAGLGLNAFVAFTLVGADKL